LLILFHPAIWKDAIDSKIRKKKKNENSK